MDSVRPLEPEKRFNGGQCAGEAKTSVADQRSCFKCKKTGHIARYCTAVDSTTKKAGAGVVVKTTEVNTAEVRKPAEGPTMEVTDDLQNEVEGGMLKLTSGNSVPVMTNCAALRDPEKSRSLGLPVLKGEIGGREVDVMRDTGCEGVVVRKQLVDASQLTGECCLMLRIDNTALLAEKAVISLRTRFFSGEVQVLCIPDANYDVIVGNVEGARSPEDPDMSMVVGAATTRAQAKRKAVTKPLRVPDIERHAGVGREQLIKLQQEDPRILPLVDAGRTSRRGGKIVSFEKARGITVNDLKYGDELTLDQRKQLEEVAVTYSSIFSGRPSTASTEEHCIELTSSFPVRQRPYPVPYAMRQTLRDELREMEDLGVIRKSSSPYASPVVVVKKKDGTNRVCIDYRWLNKLTIFDPQPMAPPADIFEEHSLGRGAIGLQDENVEKVRNAPRPKTKREVRAFLGLVGYYKEFVPNLAAVSAPLSDLERKGQPNVVNWGDSQERAYNSLKVASRSYNCPMSTKSSSSERMHLIADWALLSCRRVKVRYSR
ncbi:Pol polyprotein [Plakobranchus ocellatus]|uniref:Pol polyprotein n=1 Tax=Plakobranchus ocellatus TaxID=259542 RepID=A0AAV4B5Y9_9GAST|nr:Pol polyprotein [Plakobranchus ocellatus]